MKIISLFCGAGGMDLGFVKAGHEIVWANDFDQDSCDTYKKHFKHNVVCKPIEEVDSEKIPDGDVVIGGFPCQGFSVANKYRDEKDERNQLYLELKRVISEKNPKYFVAENVKGITSLGGYDSKEDKAQKKGKIFKKILKELSEAGKLGYHVEFKILNAVNFGVPQNRERTIILGTRKDIKNKLTHPTPITLNNPKVLRDAIGDLPEEPNIFNKKIGRAHV